MINNYSYYLFRSYFMPQNISQKELLTALQSDKKQGFNDKEQINILYFILEDAKDKAINNKKILALIENNQTKLKSIESLNIAINTMNQFIIDLEANDHDGMIINHLRKHGFYRILYRNPQIKGQELPKNDILHMLLRYGFAGIAASALITVIFFATVYFSAPFWLTAIVTGLFVGASTYLSGILYGVVNDIFATHFNLPYFLLGHQPRQKSLLRTNDKIAQGIAWGVAATFGPVVLASILFAIVATITAFFVPIATFVLPIMIITMPMIALGVELFAHKKALEYEKSDDWRLNYIGSNTYQTRGLKYMCPTKKERATWIANSDRNMFGFTKVPLIGLGALLGIIVLSAIGKFLPSSLFMSPMIAMTIPVVFAGVTSLMLLAAGAYMYVNRNKQLDDRYRLEFDRAEVEPNLYLDEDITYVKELITKYKIDKTDAIADHSVNTLSASPNLVLQAISTNLAAASQENSLAPGNQLPSSQIVENTVDARELRTLSDQAQKKEHGFFKASPTTIGIVASIGIAYVVGNSLLG